MGGGSSGSSDGIGGSFPLTDSVLRGVVAALKDIGPAAETTLLIAAHGKGKSDGAAALVAYLKRHAPELADRVAGRTALLISARAGGCLYSLSAVRLVLPFLRSDLPLSALTSQNPAVALFDLLFVP